jgi:O-antigen/teichoic acid export membrane protein
MAGLGDVRDVMRGVVASFFGFGGRLIARALLMIVAGRAFGIEALGLLGQIAAITEIGAAIGVMGLKRGLLDTLSLEEQSHRRAEPRILEALGVAIIISIAISAALLGIWSLILPEGMEIAPLLLVGVPAIVFTDISLTAVKHKRIIGWDVWARGIAEPWSFLAFAIIMLSAGMIGDGLIIAYIGSILVAATFAGIGLVRTYGFRELAFSKPEFNRLLSTIKKSAPIGITDIGVMALRRADLIVMSMFVGPEGVGLYYMVQQIASVPQKTYALFEPMLSPVIARLHNKFDATKIKANLISVCRWVFIIQLSISMPMIVFGKEVLSLFGTEFAVGSTILIVILVAELIDGSFLAIETPLVFAKPALPPRLVFVAILIEVVAIAALSFIWGAPGAAIGFLIAITSLNAGRLIMVKKYLDIAVLNSSYVAPGLLAIVVMTGLFLVRHFFGIHRELLIIVSIVASISLYLALVRQFALTAADQTLFRALAQHKRRRRRRAAHI